MKQGRSTTTMTKEESAWVDATKRNGCLCCMRRGYFPDEGTCVEADHLLSGGIRRGHLFTIGLCIWHHRGRLLVQGWNHAVHREKLGPARSEGSVPFEDMWGTDDELLDEQRQVNAARIW